MNVTNDFYYDSITLNGWLLPTTDTLVIIIFEIFYKIVFFPILYCFYWSAPLFQLRSTWANPVKWHRLVQLLAGNLLTTYNYVLGYPPVMRHLD